MAARRSRSPSRAAQRPSTGFTMWRWTPRATLPINPEDIVAMRQTLRVIMSDSCEYSAFLRVRSRHEGHFTILRLQLRHTADRTPLVLAASNEVGWAVSHFVMDTPFQVTWSSALVIVSGGVIVTLITGLVYAIGPLSARPARVLRANE